ncbi:DNA-3-methyladenine glycosylase I [uncultured Lamprocystis sp.]|jgi:DNA-3-methyladenine glycosylase I|uniref:DNA-3-methyladenine glycosylase I n=1 Tax=uncultured Lamprocystis sp. TaxID=543132 RepID=UPI0025DC98DD|nr:DNA-3-methyladenine glycosylase I [uncultured Lamprocystis sp.]
MNDDTQVRCAWCGSDPLYRAYHDQEWGVPNRDERHLFEMLTLEGAQAGLSWLTILRKREGYRQAFAGFHPQTVARFDAVRVAALLADPGIVRNRLKVESTVSNAQVLLALHERGQTLSALLWGFVDGVPRQNTWASLAQVPAKTPESDRMSRELKRLGFRFVGSTICYALMQAVGMVNDHTIDCFRHPLLAASGAR